MHHSSLCLHLPSVCVCADVPPLIRTAVTLDLGPTLIAYGHILPGLHLQRPYFQTRSHSWVLDGHEFCVDTIQPSVECTSYCDTGVLRPQVLACARSPGWAPESSNAQETNTFHQEAARAPRWSQGEKWSKQHKYPKTELPQTAVS